MIVTGVLYMPLQLTAITLAYFDLRVRTEGFDLALLSLAATSGSGIEATAEVPVMHERKSLITWPDIGHFALLSIAFIALYAIFIAIAAAIGMALLPAAGL
jgi:hypothetical protein